MSKLGTLVAIPLGLFAIKQLQKQFPDEKDPEPILPEGKDDTMPIVPLWPPTPVVIPPQVPSKIKIDIPEGIVPFFPETAVTAGKEFAAKDPFAGLKDLPKFGDISSLNFQTGLFDPEVQARLRAKK